MRAYPFRLTLRFVGWETAPDRNEQYSYHPTIEGAITHLRLTHDDYGHELDSARINKVKGCVVQDGALVTFDRENGLVDHRP